MLYIPANSYYEIYSAYNTINASYNWHPCKTLTIIIQYGYANANISVV